MNVFQEKLWPKIIDFEGTIFPSHSILTKGELYHDRPSTSVYRFTVQEKKELETYYLKCYRSGEAVSEYNVLVNLENIFSEEKNLGVVKPLLYVPNINGFITKEFRGVNLYRLIKKGTLLVDFFGKKSCLNVDAIESLALWFKVLQSNTLEEEKKYDFSSVLGSDINKDLDKCSNTGMLTDHSLSMFEEVFSSKVKLLENRSYSPAGINVDAKLWNFLFWEGELKALDFVGYKLGPANYDIARIWIGLNWLKAFPTNSSKKVSFLQEKFMTQFKEYELFDEEAFDLFRMAFALEITAFYSTIFKDPFRKKFRNTVFFPLIKKYYRELIAQLCKC